MTAAYFAEKLGRKNTLLYLCNGLTVIYVTCYLLSKYAKLISFLSIGRLLSGFRIGISTTVAAAYILESSPSEYRNFAGTSLDFR